MTKDQLDKMRKVFDLSEKLDNVLNPLTKSEVKRVSVRYSDPSNNHICTMSIEAGERITIDSSLLGTLNISEKKRATLAALADMIGTALVSTLKEEHGEVKEKIESWEIEGETL